VEQLLAALLEANRHQRHDFLNHLQVVWGYLKLNKPDRAIEYIKEVTTYFQGLRDLNNISSAELAANVSSKVIYLGLNKCFTLM